MGRPQRDDAAAELDVPGDADRAPDVDFGVFALDASEDESFAVSPQRAPCATELFALAKGVVFAERYRLGERIARGGMGSVWAATDERLGREVAVKFMSPELVDDLEYRSRFEQEARAAAKLHSQHIVAIYEHGVADGVPFIVLERLVGEDLHARLRRVTRFPLEVCERILDHAAKALRAAHGAGIVHRDIKPQNLFLACSSEGEDEETVKLLDFGVAKHAGTSAFRTKTGVIVGSPHFMSPEQVRGHRDVGPPSDLFSLAAVLFRCVTGHRPYEGDLPQVMLKITGQPPPRATSFAPDLPAGIDTFFSRALATDPKARFQTAAEMVRAFRETTEREPGRRDGSGSRPLRRETTLRFVKSEPPASEHAIATAEDVTVLKAVVKSRAGDRASDAPTRMVPAEQAMGFTDGSSSSGVRSPWLAVAPTGAALPRQQQPPAWDADRVDRRAARASLIAIVVVVALLALLGLVAAYARF